MQNGYTALMLACEKNDSMDLVLLLINRGANLEIKTWVWFESHLIGTFIPSQHGETCLHLACQHGHKDIVSFLLEKGANIETRDKVKWLVALL